MFLEIRKELLHQANEKLADFNCKLCPDTNRQVLGIRIPVLRKIAQKIAKEDWRTYLKEANYENEYFEEIILEGLIIGYTKIELDEKFQLIKKFVPKIDSWAITDTFCPTIKVKDKELEKLWNFIIPYTKSEREFEVRFAIIMMLDNFINDQYVDNVIKLLDSIKNNKYYVQMAIAWTMAEIGIKFNNKAMDFLSGKNNLDKFTYNKILQKMIESYRITDLQKDELRKMKRK